MPQDLADIQTTKDGLKVWESVARGAILDFLRAHPGQYFSVHDFDHGKLPGGGIYPSKPDYNPFWWFANWGKNDYSGNPIAPEGFEGLSHRDPRVESSGNVTSVGFIGSPGATRLGSTREQVLMQQDADIANNNDLLDEVYSFLSLHPGKAFSKTEIADTLAPPKRRLPFQRYVEAKSPRGHTHLDITGVLWDITLWRAAPGDKPIYKDMIVQFARVKGGNDTDWFYGIPTVKAPD